MHKCKSNWTSWKRINHLQLLRRSAMTDWDKILSQAEVPIAMRERKKTYTEKTTWRVALEKEKTEGWYFFKDTKNPDKPPCINVVLPDIL